MFEANRRLALVEAEEIENEICVRAVRFDGAHRLSTRTTDAAWQSCGAVGDRRVRGHRGGHRSTFRTTEWGGSTRRRIRSSLSGSSDRAVRANLSRKWEGHEREGGRMPKRDMILDRIEQWSRRHQKRDLAEQAQARGIPASPVSTMTVLAQDPQLLARRFLRELELLDLGPTLFPVGAVARKMDAALGTAPRLGEHTQSFFGALGWASRSARIWAARDSPLRGSHSLEMLGAAFGWVATSREVGILGLLVVVYRTIFRDINAFE
jgi:hypothetical protein